MLGTGGGAFSAPAVFPVAGVYNALEPYNTPGPLAVGDMNGDGIPDIVTNGITILFGDGKGGFPTRRDFLGAGGEPVILTDFDGDGKMDVLIGDGNPLILAQANRTGDRWRTRLPFCLGMEPVALPLRRSASPADGMSRAAAPL